MRRILTTIALIALTIGGVACGKGKTTQGKIALYTANTDAGILAFVEATKKLQDAGKLNGPTAASNYAIARKATDAIDIIRDRARTGWSKGDALSVIDDLIADVNRAEAESIVKLDPKASEQFKKVTFFAQFSLRSLKAIIEAAKEPTVPAEELRSVMAQRARANETVWTDIVLILQEAILRGISQSRMDTPEAFADGEALHVLIGERLAAYAG